MSGQLAPLCSRVMTSLIVASLAAAGSGRKTARPKLAVATTAIQNAHRFIPASFGTSKNLSPRSPPGSASLPEETILEIPEAARICQPEQLPRDRHFTSFGVLRWRHGLAGKSSQGPGPIFRF